MSSIRQRLVKCGGLRFVPLLPLGKIAQTTCDFSQSPRKLMIALDECQRLPRTASLLYCQEVRGHSYSYSGKQRSQSYPGCRRLAGHISPCLQRADGSEVLERGQCVHDNTNQN